jgi:hypothetical protein
MFPHGMFVAQQIYKEGFNMRLLSLIVLGALLMFPNQASSAEQDKAMPKDKRDMGRNWRVSAP